MGGWKALVVVVALATEAAASTVSVTRVDRARAGWVRIEVRYATARTPGFRLVPTGGCIPLRDSLIASTVRIAPRHRRAKLRMRDDFAWLGDDTGPCRPTGLSVEMIEDRKVVASAGVPLALPAQRRFVVPAALPPPERTLPQLGIAGQKDRAPATRMSQASVTWSLSERLLFHLSYERTAFAPTMAKDHDDGILTGVKVRF
jgi:hypothetical protein